MGWLDGQVALVTGGGSGIGRAVVERFVQEGARVGVLERVAERAEQLRRDFPGQVEAVQGDVTHLADNRRAVDATLSAFNRLDIFVGNAGLFDNFLFLADFPEDKLSDAFDELFAVNVKGYVLGAKVALPELMKSRGCMVFTASVASFNAAGGGPAVHCIEARRARADTRACLGAGSEHTRERGRPRRHDDRPAGPRHDGRRTPLPFREPRNGRENTVESPPQDGAAAQ